MLSRPEGLSDKAWLKVLKDIQKLETRHRPSSSVPVNIQKYDSTFGLCFSGSGFEVWPSTAHKLECKKAAERIIFHRSLKIPPVTVSAELLKLNVPPSVTSTLKTLYACSYYHSQWNIRIVEPSIGLLVKLSGYSDKTVKRALAFLRKGFYIRLIWRGRPGPRDGRYLHSCYELPRNFKHVLLFRIPKGKRRGK